MKFKVGDKVKVISQESFYYGREGVVTALVDGFSRVNFGTVEYYYCNIFLERVDDMDISERLSEVIKENQELKQKLGEQNIKLDKIKADLKRELNDKGVSDEEFRESVDFWLKSNSSLIAEVWGEDYKNAPMSVMCSMPLSEFVSKYKEYKDKQNAIRVGDEVYCLDHKYKSVVTSVENGVAVMITNNGKWSTCNTEKLHKTGKNYDIESILNRLKESD